MTDVQVSNARRIGFTALAVFSLSVLWIAAGLREPFSMLLGWFSLLLPLILTTAFVIYGAWRRAVRDAEVDAVGEDE